MTHKAERTPRWVKVFGIVALVVVLAFVVLVLTGRGGDHGPGRHTLSGDAGGHAPPSVREHGVRQP
jgi:ABC-type transporter Mla subunit MlaD